MITRPFGRSSALIAAVTLGLGLALLGGDLFAARPDGTINEYVRIGRDFVNVWQGGRLAGAGDAATVYDIDRYREALWGSLGVKGIYAYSYPPHSLLLATPISALPYPLALLLWTIASLALFVAAARPWLADIGLPGWVAVLFPASVVCVWAGHYGLLIGALSLIGFRALDTAQPRAGLAFALMTVKPHLGLLVPLILLARRRWSTIAVATLGSLALATLAALVFGTELWRTYFGVTLGFHGDLLTAPDMAFHGMMPTAAMAAIKLGSPDLATLAQSVFALAAFALLADAARRGATTRDLGLMSTTAIFLILPYAFIYDMTAHCLAVLIFAARSERLAEKLVLALAFLLPLLQIPLARMGLMIAPLALLAALWVESRVSVRDAQA